MKLLSAIGGALAILMVPAAAQAAERHHKRAAVAAVSTDRYTACTESGCGPVPFGCGKRPGIPGATGPAKYDEIVCPPFSPGLRAR